MARINSGTLTVVIFAILIGLGGAYVVRQQLHKPPLPDLPVTVAKPQDVVVPVAATDLLAGQTLSVNDIALMQLPPEKFRESKYAPLAYMRNATQIQGRTLKAPVTKGDAFLPDAFYPDGLGPGIAERLQAGYRAVTVPIENVGAVQGFARPGSFVDVLFRSLAEGERPEQTMTLLERVQVLAINAVLNPGRQVDLDRDGTVTLSVTPQQAMCLKVVEGRGSLSLTLRNPQENFDTVPIDLGRVDPLARLEPSVDPDAVPISFHADGSSNETFETAIGAINERLTLDDLLGFPSRAPKKQMEVYLGSAKSIVEFEDPQPDSYRMLLNGGRLRTPIAHEPQLSRVPPRGTAQLDRSRTPMVSSGVR
jgi:Flp pilus assembly protein CpaB